MYGQTAIVYASAPVQIAGDAVLEAFAV